MTPEDYKKIAKEMATKLDRLSFAEAKHVIDLLKEELDAMIIMIKAG
jgi:hypothetical protein